VTDTWNPQQYLKFAQARNEPFYDLLKLIMPHPNMSVIDLGCGTGQLTKLLHEELKAKHTLGIDSSLAMLEASKLYHTPHLSFRHQKVEELLPSVKFDLIFSNAALEWLPDHRQLFSKLSDQLSPHGQLAIQMPANFDYATHTIAKELGCQPPFKDLLGEGTLPNVLKVEEYSQILYDLGFARQNVRLQIYPVALESVDALLEWLKGSLLTYYQRYLSPDEFHHFLSSYRERMVNHFGYGGPIFIPYRRILLWGEERK
jgi:trans-aconitate 2-methyltransferase